MFTHIAGDWHFWTGTQFMASDESTKTLLAFPDVNDCVNWLYLNGHKDTARSLNAAWKRKRGHRAGLPTPQGQLLPPDLD